MAGHRWISITGLTLEIEVYYSSKLSSYILACFSIPSILFLDLWTYILLTCCIAVGSVMERSDECAARCFHCCGKQSKVALT